MEEKKADYINSILQLEDPYKLYKKDIVLCSTPLRDIAHRYKDDYVLIAGCGDTISVAYKYGFTKAIHVHEYSTLFPKLTPLSIKYRSKDLTEKYLSQIKKRFGDELDIEKVRKQGVSSLPIKAWFVFHDTDEMEESLQIFSDLIISKDGIPGSIRSSNDPQVVKVYTTNPDLSN